MCRTNSDPTFRNNHISGNGFAGIDVQEGARGTFEKNVIADNTVANVNALGSGNHFATVAKNAIKGAPTGVLLTDHARIFLYKNQISHCRQGMNTCKRSSPHIVGNSFSKCGVAITVSDDATGGYYVHNMIEDNTEHAIVLSHCCAPVFALNTIMGHCKKGNAAVVVKEAAGGRFQDNMFFFNCIGMEILFAAPKLIGNIFKGNECGLWCHRYTNEKELEKANVHIGGAAPPKPTFRYDKPLATESSETENTFYAEVHSSDPVMVHALPYARQCCFIGNGIGLSVTKGGVIISEMNTFSENDKFGVYHEQGPDTHLTCDLCVFSKNGVENFRAVSSAAIETALARSKEKKKSVSPSKAVQRVPVDGLPLPKASIKVPSPLQDPEHPLSLITRCIIAGPTSPCVIRSGCKNYLVSNCIFLACPLEISDAAPWIVQCVMNGNMKKVLRLTPTEGQRRGTVRLLDSVAEKDRTKSIYDTGNVSVWSFGVPHAISVHGKAYGKVVDCVVSFAADGIRLERAATEIIGTHVYQCRNSGISVAHGFTGVVDGCALFSNYGAGLRVEGKMVAPASIRNCKVFHNLVHPVLSRDPTTTPPVQPSPADSPILTEIGNANKDLELPDVSFDAPFSGVEVDTRSRRETCSSPKYTLPPTDGPGIGIFVEASGLVLLETTQCFANGLSNVLASSKNKSVVSRCHLYAADGYGLVVRSSCSVDVKDTFLLDNVYAGALCETNATPVFTNCTFHGNTIGVVCSGDAAEVLRSVFHNNRIAGVRAVEGSRCLVADCEISACGTGLECRYGEKTTPTVEHCTFTNNLHSGILCTGLCRPTLRSNVVSDHDDLAGILVRCGAKPIIQQCMINNNQFGLVSRLYAEPEVVDCIYRENAVGAVVEWSGQGSFVHNKWVESKDHAVMVRVQGDAVFYQNLFIREASILITTEGKSTFTSNTFKRPTGSCFLVVKGGDPTITYTKFCGLHHTSSHIIGLKHQLQPLPSGTKENRSSLSSTPINVALSPPSLTLEAPTSPRESRSPLSSPPGSRRPSRRQSLRRRSMLVRPTSGDVMHRRSIIGSFQLSKEPGGQGIQRSDSVSFASDASMPSDEQLKLKLDTDAAIAKAIQQQEEGEAAADARIPVKIELGGRGTVTNCLFGYNNAPCSVVVDGNTTVANIQNNVFIGHEMASALLISNGASPSIDCNWFLNNNAGVILSQVQCPLRKCMFFGNLTAVEAFSGTKSSISDCEFVADNLGVNSLNGSAISVTNCHWHSCDHAAFFEKGSEPKFTDNVINNSLSVAITCETKMTISKCQFFGGLSGVKIAAGGFVDMDNVEMTALTGTALQVGALVDDGTPSSTQGSLHNIETVLSGSFSAFGEKPKDEAKRGKWGGSITNCVFDACGVALNILGMLPNTPNSSKRSSAAAPSDNRKEFTVMVTSDPEDGDSAQELVSPAPLAQSPKQVTFTVKDCKFHYCGTGVRAAHEANPLIELNKFYQCDTGVELRVDAVGNVKRCEIIGCGIGVKVEGGHHMKEPCISHCNILDATEVGVLLASKADGNIIDCHVFDCAVGVLCTDFAKTLIEHTNISHPSNNVAKSNDALKKQGSDVAVVVASTTKVTYDHSPAYNSQTAKQRRLEASKSKGSHDQLNEKAVLRKADEENQARLQLNVRINPFHIAVEYLQSALPSEPVEALDTLLGPQPPANLPLVVKERFNPDGSVRGGFARSMIASPEMKALATPAEASINPIENTTQLVSGAGTRKRVGANVGGTMEEEDEDHESGVEASDVDTQSHADSEASKGTEKKKALKKKGGLKALVAKAVPKKEGLAALVSKAAKKKGSAVDKGPFGDGPIKLPQLFKVKKKPKKGRSGQVRRASNASQPTQRRMSAINLRRDSSSGRMDDDYERSGSLQSMSMRRSVDRDGVSGDLSLARALAITNTPPPDRDPNSTIVPLLPPLPPPKQHTAYPRKRAEIPVKSNDPLVPLLPPVPPTKIAIKCTIHPQHGKFKFSAETYAQLVAIGKEVNPLFADQVLNEFDHADRRKREHLCVTDVAAYIKRLCELYRFHPGRYEATKNAMSAVYAPEELGNSQLIADDFEAAQDDGGGDVSHVKFAKTPSPRNKKDGKDVVIDGPLDEPLFVEGLTSFTDLWEFSIQLSRVLFAHLRKDLDTDSISLSEFSDFVRMTNTPVTPVCRLHFTWMEKEAPQLLTALMDETEGGGSPTGFQGFGGGDTDILGKSRSRRAVSKYV